jgi:ATP/maltotriose-dependent transcriptional regulator MalT
MTGAEAVARGRAAFGRQAWAEAYRELNLANREISLGPEDLDRFATAAYLVGEESVSVEARARAHASFLESGDLIRAARSAFWLGYALISVPAQQAHANGWLSRARRLLDECGAETVEHGFLLCTSGYLKILEDDLAAALDSFEQAERVGARFRNTDVTALAQHAQARVLLRMNRRPEGFALLDEVMVAVTGGEVVPMIAGMIYCSVISACYDVFDSRRAQEWTDALSNWCTAHPDVVPFRGQCLVRRSELMQLHGAWQEALAEAERATTRLSRTPTEPDAGPAHYQQGELHRLRGDLTRAEESYRRASQTGRKPHPGLALLRLAQGNIDGAGTAARRMLEETREPRGRARLLGAAVEIMIAQRDLVSARAAAEELSEIARGFDSGLLQAAAAYASGAIALAAGDAAGSLEPLRTAWAAWQELRAPYDVARVRELIGRAYRELGDEEGAQMEFECAQEAFDRLGAAPDAARVAALALPSGVPVSQGLTGREVEVLRLVATGKTNRAIAQELAISEKTVARHLSNIFTKLDLSSRSAATAYAYEHKLL